MWEISGILIFHGNPNAAQITIMTLKISGSINIVVIGVEWWIGVSSWELVTTPPPYLSSFQAFGRPPHHHFNNHSSRPAVLLPIFNQSLNTSTLLEDWLKANKAQFSTKGVKTWQKITGQYHSLLYICHKVIEHEIYKHILSHVEKLQHGFRIRYSCQTQLIVTL